MKRKEHNIPAMYICPESLDKAIDGLLGAFEWHKSKQSDMFWSKVHDKLCEIREKASK